MIKTNIESVWMTVVGSTVWFSSFFFSFRFSKTQVLLMGAKNTEHVKRKKMLKYHSGKTGFGFKEVIYTLSTAPMAILLATLT